MYFTLHTTKKAERDILLSREGEEITINPSDFHKGVRPIVWEEDGGKFYEHDISNFMELLKLIDSGVPFDFKNTAYYKQWAYKGEEIETRVSNLGHLFRHIKKNGVLEPVHCEITGERLDGSFRTKIAMFLGIPEVKAILHRFTWKDIDEEFIERKLKVRDLAIGRDYYYFKYGYKDWQNISNGGPVYAENAERWELIKPLVKGKTVLDMGCNEGYIAIQLARGGKKVVGIDQEWIQTAWLNKLIFEWIDKKDIPVEFYEEDIVTTTRTADTILFLNVLYHLPKDKQKEIIMRYKGKQMIFQCNLRKEAVREQYYTSHPDDLQNLLISCGIKSKVIEWRDKPLVITI
jgi:2-polyprenyl-3-methyl-5-hydroxy-6-metoxy-1,4-benzoquinol methylase